MAQRDNNEVAQPRPMIHTPFLSGLYSRRFNHPEECQIIDGTHGSIPLLLPAYQEIGHYSGGALEHTENSEKKKKKREKTKNTTGKHECAYMAPIIPCDFNPKYVVFLDFL